MTPDNCESENSRAEDSEPWYCAKMIFSWYRLATGERLCYEERFVLIRARDFDDAIAKAEQNAKEYCDEAGIDCGVRYESFCRVFNLFDSEVGEGTEVFSDTHESPLEPAEYLERYHVDLMWDSEGRKGGVPGGQIRCRP